MSREYRRAAIEGVLGKRGKYSKEQLDRMMREEESLKARERSVREKRERKKQADKRAGN